MTGHRIKYRKSTYIPPSFTPIDYGIIYNTYAAADARNLANTDYHVMTAYDWYDIADMLHGSTLPDDAYQVANNIYTIKEVGTTHWNTANGTDETKFSFVGGAEYDNNGFSSLKSVGYLMTSTKNSSLSGNRVVDFLDSFLYISFSPKDGWGQYLPNNSGQTTRIVKDTTDLQNDGDTGFYTGNDGKIYETVRIAGIEITRKNLAETKWRDGTDIYGLEEAWSTAEWLALGISACCAPFNNWDNV